MISFATHEPVPADFIGVQPGLDDGDEGIDLFTLNQPVGIHPTGSTVSRQTLEAHGFQVPPVDKLLETLRRRRSRTLAA